MQNLGADTEHFKITLLKVSADDAGNVRLIDPGPGDDWVKWVSFSKTHFDAPSHEWQTIKMTVRVPKDAAFGYYFAVAYSRENETIDPRKPSLLGKVATLVLMDVYAPGAKKAADIGSFTLAHRVYEYLPADFEVKIQNIGNLTLIPHGDIFITRKGGTRDLASLEINKASGRVLPNSARIFAAEWADGFPHYAVKMKGGTPVTDKKGNLAKRLVWDFSQITKLRVGPYTASLLITYDDGTRDVPLESALTFWVIPWRLLLALVAIIAVVSFGFYSSFKNVGRRLRRKKRY